MCPDKMQCVGKTGYEHKDPYLLRPMSVWSPTSAGSPM